MTKIAIRRWSVLGSALLIAAGVLAATHLRTAHRRSCIANLKQIHGAVWSWSLENKIDQSESYSLTNNGIVDYMKGSRLPSCPSGGSYHAGSSISGLPTCTIEGHALDAHYR